MILKWKVGGKSLAAERRIRDNWKSRQDFLFYLEQDGCLMGNNHYNSSFHKCRF